MSGNRTTGLSRVSNPATPDPDGQTHFEGCEHYDCRRARALQAIREAVARMPEDDLDRLPKGALLFREELEAALIDAWICGTASAAPPELRRCAEGMRDGCGCQTFCAYYAPREPSAAAVEAAYGYAYPSNEGDAASCKAAIALMLLAAYRIDRGEPTDERRDILARATTYLRHDDSEPDAPGAAVDGDGLDAGSGEVASGLPACHAWGGGRTGALSPPTHA